MTQIVSSATYRQSSSVTPELLERDPYNRLLARAPRYRLAAHTIRDNALAVSGLLVEKLGGPSVKPYQPPGLWADFSFGKIKYTQDSGDALYRRSLYTFWRRSLSPPNMFDEANRQTCEVRTKRTNTPLHALTLLNDITFVEAARVFAQSLILENEQDNDRFRSAFQRALSRPPTSAEITLMNNIVTLSRKHYQQKPEEAAELGRIKANDLSGTGAELVASANIGCTLQLRRHLGDRAQVQHPMELLAASAGLHSLPSVPQRASNAKITGEGENRQSTAGPR